MSQTGTFQCPAYIRPAIRAQRGAVLYVALIMLILLALLGIAGMQVAGVQERMAASYRAVNLAFQRTEGLVREVECGLELLNEVSGTAGCTIVSRSDVETRCDDGFDPGAWVRARSLADAPAHSIRQIETCMPGESELGLGTGPENERRPIPIYQITTYQGDTASNPSSVSAIDSIFKL